MDFVPLTGIKLDDAAHVFFKITVRLWAAMRYGSRVDKRRAGAQTVVHVVGSREDAVILL